MIQIDAMSRIPVYEQLVDQIERLILVGLMQGGEQLPSIRSLSLKLSINPNTIQKAYAELERRKLIHSVPGKGCFVSQQIEEQIKETNQKKLMALKAIVSELRQAGMEKQDIIQIIDEVYKDEGGWEHD